MSSAAVSEATTQPRSSRPSDSGRTPYGSRAAYRVFSSMKVRQNAPRTVGQQFEGGLFEGGVGGTVGQQRAEDVGVGGGGDGAAVCPSSPSSRARAASSAVLTRLPLWPSATPVPAAVLRNTGCAFSQVVEPVVE